MFIVTCPATDNHPALCLTPVGGFSEVLLEADVYAVREEAEAVALQLSRNSDCDWEVVPA